MKGEIKVSKIQSKLMPNETLITELKPYLPKLILTSKNTWIGILLIIISIVLTILTEASFSFIIGAILLSLLLFIPIFFKYYFTNYYLTNKRLIRQTDIIGKDYDYTLLNAILDVNVDVTILDKILGTGTVKFSNSNVVEFCIIPDIKDPHKIVNLALENK